MNKKTLFMIIGGILLCIAFFVGIEMYEDYRFSYTEDEISAIEAEIAELDSGNYSSIETGGSTSYLTLSNFSADSDGTYVNAYGSITNTSSEYIDETGEIAFFNSDGSINRVKYIMVELEAGETLHFEELIGLTSEGTLIPSSAELTGF